MRLRSGCFDPRPLPVERSRAVVRRTSFVSWFPVVSSMSVIFCDRHHDSCSMAQVKLLLSCHLNPHLYTWKRSGRSDPNCPSLEESVTWLNADRSWSGTGGWKSVVETSVLRRKLSRMEFLQVCLQGIRRSRRTSENLLQWSVQPMTDPTNLRG